MGDKIKVLIVDDSFDDLERAKNVLEKQDYEVFTSTNGAKALEMLGLEHFNLILVNINMPTFSGYDLLRLLRVRLGNGVKIAYVSVTPEKDVDMSGADGFIQKPYSEEGFLESVKEILNKEKGGNN